MKDGGGTRCIQLNPTESITVEQIKAESLKLFCRGIAKYGKIEEMKMQIDNFAREVIEQFTNLKGEACDYQEYLRCHGLFPSKCKLYLMTSYQENEDEMDETAPKDDNSNHSVKVSEVMDSEMAPKDDNSNHSVNVSEVMDSEMATHGESQPFGSGSHDKKITRA